MGSFGHFFFSAPAIMMAGAAWPLEPKPRKPARNGKFLRRLGFDSSLTADGVDEGGRFGQAVEGLGDSLREDRVIAAGVKRKAE